LCWFSRGICEHHAAFVVPAVSQEHTVCDGASP
jgi:hypothetical protein